MVLIFVTADFCENREILHHVKISHSTVLAINHCECLIQLYKSNFVHLDTMGLDCCGEAVQNKNLIINARYKVQDTS